MLRAHFNSHWIDCLTQSGRYYRTCEALIFTDFGIVLQEYPAGLDAFAFYRKNTSHFPKLKVV